MSEVLAAFCVGVLVGLAPILWLSRLMRQNAETMRRVLEAQLAQEQTECRKN